MALSYPDQSSIIASALAGDVVVNIGHIAPETVKKLDKLAREGTLAKWKGYWHPIPGAPWGIGPLKSCWGPHSIAEQYAREAV